MSELTITIRGLGWRQVALAAGGAVLAVALAASAIWYIREHTTLAGLPHDSYASLSFSAYFPHHPPSDFSFDPASVNSQPNVLSYTYHYQHQKTVFVSIQPLDPKLDVDSFRPTREISPSIGHGYLADYDTRTTVAILAGKSLVLINSPDGVPDAAVELFADSLAHVK